MLRVTKKLAVLTAVATSLVVVGVAASEASELNLTAGGTNISAYGAIWSTTEIQPIATGPSGVIDAFVRIADSNPSTRNVVDGMSTSATGTALLNDEQTGTKLNQDVLTSSVAVKTIGTTQYYEFLLDINQDGGDPLLTLSGLQLCTSKDSGLSFKDTCGGNDATLPGTGKSTLKYDMQVSNGATGYASGTSTTIVHAETQTPTNTVLLDANLNRGSGSGDLFVYIPVSTLGSLADQNNKYLYLWSQFGAPVSEGATNNGAYEEWAFLNTTVGATAEQFNVTNPEPGSLVLLGTGLLFGGHLIRRRSRKQQAARAA